MRIGIIGAGAIGGLVAGYLRLKGEDVSLVGHPGSVNAIKENGLCISGARGNFNVAIEASLTLGGKKDLVILAVKTQDLKEAIKDNAEFLKEGIVLTAQNGLEADRIAAEYIPAERLVCSIVMFGATSLEPGIIVHNFEGNWIIGGISPGAAKQIGQVKTVLGKIFPTPVGGDIRAMKYLKIFINANNCLPALLGVSMQEAFADLAISRISVNIWKEGLGIAAKSGIKLTSLPDFPLERITGLASLPETVAANIFSGIMVNLSKEPVYGSILQSIKRGRPSEIDYLNGEFVSLARQNNLRAPLNQRLVELVHEVEKTGRFLSKEELLEQIRF
ncbi:MAG: ketopantoate reductase family protein [Deltaproteobacteria bacterium]